MPERDDFSLCMLNNARQAARAISRRYDAYVRQFGLKAAQFTVLVLVRENPGKTTSDLAVKGVLERTTLVRNLAVLEKNGLITSQGGEKGAGKVHRLTPKGAALLEEALPQWRKAQADLEAELGAQAFTETIRALQVLSKA